MLKAKEAEDAQIALIAWFKSQDINPFEGCQIMVGLIAHQLVAKTTDIDKLSSAIDSIKILLAFEIAQLIKNKDILK